MMKVPVLAGVHNLNERVPVLLGIESQWSIATFVVCDTLLEVADSELLVLEFRIIWAACFVLCMIEF